MTNLLKKDVEWFWHAQRGDAFQAIKNSLLHASVMVLPVPDHSLSVASGELNFAIGVGPTCIRGKHLCAHV